MTDELITFDDLLDAAWADFQAEPTWAVSENSRVVIERKGTHCQILVDDVPRLMCSWPLVVRIVKGDWP